MHFIFILFSLILCCKEPNTEIQNPKQIFYINSLLGANLFEKPDLDSMVILSIPHAKEVVYLNESVFLEGSKILLKKIEFAGVKGYLRNDFLSEKAEKFYFLVNSNGGLNLRENPDSNSKILKIIPAGFIGEFLNRAIDLENEKIFWLQIEYNGQVGWIHSAFTLISSDRQNLEDRAGFGSETWFYSLYSNLEKNTLEEYKYTEEDQVNLVFEKLVENYKIYFVEYPISEEDCNSRKSRIVFQNLFSKKFYSRKSVFSEKLIETNQTLPGTVYIETQICNCCCEVFDGNLFFLLKDKIIPIDFRNKDLKASCIVDGEISILEMERSSKIIKDNNQILLYYKLPNCKFDELEISKTGIGRKFKGFKGEVFIDIQKKDESIFLKKYYNEGIPKTFLEKWK